MKYLSFLLAAALKSEVLLKQVLPAVTNHSFDLTPIFRAALFDLLAQHSRYSLSVNHVGGLPLPLWLLLMCRDVIYSNSFVFALECFSSPRQGGQKALPFSMCSEERH